MSRDDHILQSWFSPSYPVGSFAYSHGLEVAISTGDVTDAVLLESWLADVLRLGTGRSDAILLAQTLRGADADEIGALAEALATSRERHLETTAQGRAFAEITSSVWSTDPTPYAYPVAVGVAARQLSLDPSRVIRYYLHAFTANLISAAIRFMPLGQTAGQQVLARLFPVVEDVTAFAERATLGDLGTGTLRADLAAMRHETLETRIFRT